MAIKHACAHSDCTEEGIFTVEDGEHLCMHHIHERIYWLPVEGRKVYFETMIKIIRVNVFCPAVPNLLFHCPTDEVEPGLVEPVAERVSS